MKKVKKLLLILGMVGLLTGCTLKMHIGFKIDNNKKISIQTIQAMDNEMIDAMIKFGESNNEEENNDDIQITDEMRWEYLKKSIIDDNEIDESEAEKYEQNNYKGYIITKEIGNIDDYVTESITEERVNINDDSLDGKKLFIKNNDIYKSNLSIKNDSEEVSSMTQYQSMGAIFDVKFIVTLPNKSISNNADSVSEDGLTLTWDLLKTNANIDFEFKFDNNTSKNVDINQKANKSNLLLYLGIGGFLIAIAAIIIIILVTKSKKNDSEHVDNHINQNNSESLDNSINQNDNKAKFCPNCGKEVNTNFCENCGTKMS